ncbi:MAG: serine hydrolase [Leptolyngbyaceae cyanobacterium RM1_1_2]|nr:serine hydrolase [Leptolyngbyaceae cyanobacterium RM1_1_2]
MPPAVAVPYVGLMPNHLAQNVMPEPIAALERVLTSPTLQAGWFADSFLAAVSLAQVEQIVRGLRASLGTYQGTESKTGGYLVLFERGSLEAQITLNRRGQITGLIFQPPVLSNLSLDEIQQRWAALPGEVSFLVLQDGARLVSYQAEQPLGVGSAFKLIVLQALQRQIEAGQHTWDQVIQLQLERRSLPSGILQTWPAAAPVTLQTLATLMISLSDNTATDALIHLVGQEALTALSPRNRPFLTTREFFVLKDPQNLALLERYRQGDSAERSQVLTGLADLLLPDVALFEGAPLALDVEWFLSADELCEAIASVADLPLMQINPGIADPQDWAQVAFKGGSESGVLNLTTYLKAENGIDYCVAATWNNPAGIDETEFMALYGSAIAALRSPVIEPGVL